MPKHPCIDYRYPSKSGEIVARVTYCDHARVNFITETGGPSFCTPAEFADIFDLTQPESCRVKKK